MVETGIETIRDYSLTGAESKLALEKGLAEAAWYITPLPREAMKELLVRKDWPAIRDSVLWFGLIFGSGYLFFLSWGHWWVVFPYIVYSVLYGSTSDSRWHESSHGTAFKTSWLNNVLYEVSSFMVFRQSVVWRWSHTRHHSDTIIRGRDPEIAVPRPANLLKFYLGHFALFSTPREFSRILLHATGRIHPEVAPYLPKSEYGKVFIRARIYLLIYASVIGLSIFYRTLLPLFFIGFPTFLGAWLMRIYGTTQHAGLAENTLDHRLNSRTVYMNRINRYLYLNMNYHIEHHMFPLVPYHALPALHQLVKHDFPKPYKSILDAYREIIPALKKQSKDPSFYVRRELPASSPGMNAVAKSKVFIGKKGKLAEGWIEVCPVEELSASDVLRFDFQDKTYAIYRLVQDDFYSTDGICTHGHTHLADGLVIGDQVECAKHNGRFGIKDGSVKRPPVCVGLKTYPVETRGDKIYLGVDMAAGAGADEESRATTMEVVSNRNASTFIKELILRPVNDEKFAFRPGDYIQLEIPVFNKSLKYIQVDQPFRKTWKQQGIFRYFANNPTQTKRNYSMASNPEAGSELRFNIRLATPPEGLNSSAGVGSSFAIMLRPGDMVKLYGPYGDFHIKDTDKEMVYIGGGAGMAPLRSHISYLFETLKTTRKVKYWYGGRSLQEIFYEDYFQALEKDFNNFSFHVALSEPGPDEKLYPDGFIHEIVLRDYLGHHPDPASIEYYLCGPPEMIAACLDMLHDLKVGEDNISFDEF
jgi:Na+-transporting NADH:ubiquinone oxidoreductase subunit F